MPPLGATDWKPARAAIFPEPPLQLHKEPEPELPPPPARPPSAWAVCGPGPPAGTGGSGQRDYGLEGATSGKDVLTTPSRLRGPGGSTIEKWCRDKEVPGASAPRRLEDDKALQRTQPNSLADRGMLLHLGPVHLPLQSVPVALLFVLLLLRLRVLKREMYCLFVLQTEKLN